MQSGTATCPTCALTAPVNGVRRFMAHDDKRGFDCAGFAAPVITRVVDTGRRPVPYVAPDRNVATRNEGATSPPAGDRSTPASHRAAAHAAAPVPEGGRA